MESGTRLRTECDAFITRDALVALGADLGIF